MSMQWTAEYLSQTGEPRDAAMAEVIDGLLKLRGSDVPLPDGEQSDVPRPITGVELVNIGDLASRTLVLRDEARSVLTTTPEATSLEVQNLAKLRALTERVTAPYASLFNGLVPDVEANERTIFGRIKEGKVGTKTWGTTEVHDDLTIDYSYFIKWIQGRQANNLERVNLGIHSQHDNDKGWYQHGAPEPRLDISFKDGLVTGLKLEWNQATPTTLMKLAGGTLLAKLVDDNFIFGNNSQDRSAIVLRFVENPELRLWQQFGGYMRAPIRGVTTDSRFIFRPQQDMFSRQMVDEQLQAKLGLSTEPNVSVAEFLALVNDVLSLVPTIDLNDHVA